MAAEAVAESGYGNVATKTEKNLQAPDAVWYALKGKKSVGVIGEDLEKRLADDKNAIIVLMHYPVVSDSSFCLQNTVERNRLLRDFANSNVKMIFSGHYHRGDTHHYGSMTEVTVKSFGFNGTALLVTVDNATQSIKCREINF
ncbi:MAG: hypothetical protein K2M90_04830 [Treponemataceae bacterium]|nr:hypothetical protein [Treponemataceae bacterium]